MTTEIEFELFITPLSQFHIGTGFGVGRFIDKATSKDKLGAIYIPGSTIKGKAKYFGRQIAMSLGVDCCRDDCRDDQPCKDKPCVICRTFGSPLRQGKFFFSDAKIDKKLIKILEEQENPAISMRFLLNTRTGTKIDRRTGTVQEDYLFTTESGMRGIRLTSKIYGRGNDFTFRSGNKTPFELLLLKNSLKLITHLGGGVSRGFGRVKLDIGKTYINGVEVDE